MKTPTLQKLQQVYDVTRWPHFNVIDVKKWGTTVEELEQLEKDGHIIRRRGINSTLIELLTFK
ncbi:MAG: hypothetical protein PHS05_02185 [Bacteroidales bacterium]|nr:hypothetical protein [Bacteroidales bacterium]